MRVYYRIRDGQIVFGPAGLFEAATSPGGDQMLGPHNATEAELRAIGLRWADAPAVGSLQRAVHVSASYNAGTDEVDVTWSVEDSDPAISSHNANQSQEKRRREVARLRASGTLEDRVKALELLMGE